MKHLLTGKKNEEEFALMVQNVRESPAGRLRVRPVPVEWKDQAEWRIQRRPHCLYSKI